MNWIEIRNDFLQDFQCFHPNMENIFRKTISILEIRDDKKYKSNRASTNNPRNAST